MIKNPIQTKRAYLTWQCPLSQNSSRNRHIVGELFVDDDDRVSFSYLPDVDLEPAIREGYRSYPGLLPDDERTRYDAVSVLMKRLPPRDRSDFSEYLRAFGLVNSPDLTDLSLLAYTGARIKSDDDSFGIADTFEGFDQTFDYVFDVAGVRHYREVYDRLSVDDPVRFMAEPDNEYDQNAVKIVNQSEEIVGYLNKLQAPQMLGWLRNGVVEARVFRKNGRPSYPRLFIFSTINPHL